MPQSLNGMTASTMCSPVDRDMHSPDVLKQIFQEGWNVPARVDNYVRNVAEGEFTEGKCCEAWCEALLAAIQVPGELDVLDVGTGPGIFACLYARMGHRSVGLDFSRRMLAEATKRAEQLRAACEFVFGDAESLPFDANRFDVVSSRHLLFNLPRPGIALREWVRVLKPGGRMILIGEDSEGDSRRSLGGQVRRITGWCQKRWLRHRNDGWHAKPDYLRAVSECPLFRNCTPKMLHVLLDAVDLTDVHCCSTDAIYAARLAKLSSHSRYRRRGRPFVLVGTKPFVQG